VFQVDDVALGMEVRIVHGSVVRLTNEDEVCTKHASKERELAEFADLGCRSWDSGIESVLEVFCENLRCSWCHSSWKKVQ
jgi:hypothetical protein